MTTGRINQVAALHLRPAARERAASLPRLPRRSVHRVVVRCRLSTTRCCDASGEPHPRAPEAAAADQTHACVEAHSWLLPGLSVNDPKGTGHTHRVCTGFPQAAPSREPPAAERERGFKSLTRQEAGVIAPFHL